MKKLTQVNPFNVESTKNNICVLTTLSTENSVSTHGSISFTNKTLMANYVYDAENNYKLTYTILCTDGQVTSFVEDDGILPTLFLSPEGENYVSIIPYHPDKELEVNIPIFNRENTELPKGNRPFTGDFIGNSGPYAIFFDVDSWSDKKLDNMLAIEFKGGKINKKHQVKIESPRQNKIFIDNDEIHLLAKEQNKWIHRLIDGKGNILRQRSLHSERSYYREIISLSFDTDSYLLTEEKNGQLLLEQIDTNGQVKSVKLLFEFGAPLFNTWRPTKIGKNTFIIRFNDEFGNGWITIKESNLLELFYNKGEKGYRNVINDELLALDDANLIIASVNKTTDNAYAIVFYPKKNDKKIIVLNRQI